jgi:hypothetical protein
MLNNEKKVTVEWIKTTKDGKNVSECSTTNPIFDNYSQSDKLSIMISKILNDELPMLKDNSLLHDLVLYSLLEKIKTVQSVENVLSYIKENHAKQVHDVSFKNGEVCIKCST